MSRKMRHADVHVVNPFRYFPAIDKKAKGSILSPFLRFGLLFVFFLEPEFCRKLQNSRAADGVGYEAEIGSRIAYH